MPTPLKAFTTLVVAALAAASLVSCENPDEDRVRAIVTELRQAYLTQDYRRACALMSPRARLEIGELGHLRPTVCARDLKMRLSAAVLSRRDRLAPIIVYVDVDGDRAIALATLGGSTPAELRFAKQDGQWKLDRVFGATAGPAPDLE